MQRVLGSIAIAACAHTTEPAWNPPPPVTASEQGRTPAIITTQEWSEGAGRFCYGGPRSAKLMFYVYPDRCISATYPRLSVRCMATQNDDTLLDAATSAPPSELRTFFLEKRGPATTVRPPSRAAGSP